MSPLAGRTQQGDEDGVRAGAQGPQSSVGDTAGPWEWGAGIGSVGPAPGPGAFAAEGSREKGEGVGADGGPGGGREADTAPTRPIPRVYSRA